MATRKDNLTLNLNQEGDSTGTITYANEVIAIIAGVAANEIEGVAGMCSGGGISDVFGRNKNITKGVKVELGTEEAAVDIYLVVEYGTPIQTAANNVQENVRKAIESMTGLHVVRVDVHVQGVSFEKEQKVALEGLESLKSLESVHTPDSGKQKKNAKASKPAKPAEPVHVEFEGEPTPAESHEPVELDLEEKPVVTEAEPKPEVEAESAAEPVGEQE